MNRLGTLIVLASIGLGIPAFASAQDMKTVATVNLVSKETKQIVKLPPKTRDVNFRVSGGSIYCSHIMLTYEDGKTSSWQLDSPFHDKVDRTSGIAKGYPGAIVSVTVECKSDGSRSSVVFTASPCRAPEIVKKS